ncbi:MAG: sensor histidine kinase, partial [Microthrixaceae bacterium]|nr:sensor histidine kinase [Microthrixaceae bacterium]
GSDTPTGVVCRRDLMARAVRNLVDNACKFSPVGTPVEVTVSTTAATEAVADGLSIEVKDRGPGIEQAELELIFDRFHRSDSARSLPGSGLGLSIVAEVAAAHGGRVLARNRRAGGAAVGIWVPLTPDSYRGPDLV